MAPVIMMVTGCAGTPDGLAERVAVAARAGVHLIQIRERNLDARHTVELARACVRAVQGTRARILVNDRLDVALAAGASGAHLRTDSVAPLRARTLMPRPALLGQSFHGLAQIDSVDARETLDYLVFGTVFSSASKPGREPAGIEALARIAARTPLPIVAIGGVTLARLPELARSGAAGFAAISLFRDTPLRALAETIARARDAWRSGAGRG